MTDQLLDRHGLDRHGLDRHGLDRHAPRSGERAAARPRRRGPGRVTQGGMLAEFALGFLLLSMATLAGIVFVRRPWSNRLDALGFRLLPADLSSHWASAFTSLGSMTALIAGVIVVFVIGLRRDWVRAISFATSPVIAVLIVQEIAKPLVDRHYGGGGPSYPSGTVTAVAALVTALILVMPGRIRLPVAGLGALAVVGTGAAVVVLRWHYPTDALGGFGVGVGSVLLIDALLHAPWVVPRALRSLAGIPAERFPTLS
jgi:membrane-associated phospholipid phosphatase